MARRGVSIGALPKPDGIEAAGIEPGAMRAGDDAGKIGDGGDHGRPGLGRQMLVWSVSNTADGSAAPRFRQAW